MEIDVHYSTVKNQQAAEKRQGRNSRETAQQVGTIIPGDDSGPEKKHISGDSNSQDPSSDGIEEQENSNASHQSQANQPCIRTVNPNPADQKKKDPIPERGNRKRPPETSTTPASKATKRGASNQAARRAAKKAHKMA